MDDDFGVVAFAGILIGGFILSAIIGRVALSPGRRLRWKFQKLGKLNGMLLPHIVAKVGGYNSKTSAANGRTIYQWIVPGYHISLIVYGEICEGVAHESWARQ